MLATLFDPHNGRKFNALQNNRYSVGVMVLTVGIAFGGRLATNESAVVFAPGIAHADVS
jgi:hypothetical protein